MPENYILNRKSIQLKKHVFQQIEFTPPHIISNLVDYAFQIEFPSAILLSPLEIAFEFVNTEGYRTKYLINNMDVISGIYFDFQSRIKSNDYNRIFTSLELTANIDAHITLTIKHIEGGFTHTGLV